MIILPKSLKIKSNRKEEKKMKNLFAILMAITMAISTTGLSLAAVNLDGSETFVAKNTPAAPANPVTVAFSAALKNVTDDASATDMLWSSVTAGVTGWSTANQYIEVQGWAVYSTDWGIQIYTNNTNYTGQGEPAGLIRSDDAQSLPMCWRTRVGYYDPIAGTWSDPGSTAATAAERQIIEGKSGTYTVLYDGVSGNEPGGAHEYFAWFFVMDKSDPDIDNTTTAIELFGDYQTESTFVGSAGYHHAPGADVAANFADPSHPQDKYYIYMGAKFTLARSGYEYKTDTMTVEMYHL